MTPKPGTSFGNAVPITPSSVDTLFSKLNPNPAFLLDMLGLPDYWAPQKRCELGEDGKLIAFGTFSTRKANDLLPCRVSLTDTKDFFCQHPRWNLQVQGAPVSVYVKHNVKQNTTIYIVSHKINDTVITSLRSMLNISLEQSKSLHVQNVLLQNPLDIHAMIAGLSFEASKFHVKRFQRFMWTQVRNVVELLWQVLKIT